MKRLLFCRSFGIGNALMSLPAIRHYARNGFEVQVVVGGTPDDAGAYEILTSALPVPEAPCAVFTHNDEPGPESGGVRLVRWRNPSLTKYWDVGVFSIPYDGRWRWLEQFCHEVYDKRPRPDPSTFGFSSWEKHEAEYQLELAEQITGVPRRPNALTESFWARTKPPERRCVYIGVGRKRDDSGFWEQKHWGDENYAELIQKIIDRTDYSVVATGNRADLVSTGSYLMRKVRNPDRFSFMETNLSAAARIMRDECDSFIGNDTGTMHMAAAIGLPVVAIFRMPGASRKNYPLTSSPWTILEDHSGNVVTPDEVLAAWSTRLRLETNR